MVFEFQVSKKASESRLFLRYSSPIRGQKLTGNIPLCNVGRSVHDGQTRLSERYWYVDDFLAIGATRAECTQAYKVLLQLLQDLGFTISKGKLVLPTQSSPS